MKKIFILYVLALVLISSCSNGKPPVPKGADTTSHGKDTTYQDSTNQPHGPDKQ